LSVGILTAECWGTRLRGAGSAHLDHLERLKEIAFRGRLVISWIADDPTLSERIVELIMGVTIKAL